MLIKLAKVLEVDEEEIGNGNGNVYGQTETSEMKAYCARVHEGARANMVSHCVTAKAYDDRSRRCRAGDAHADEKEIRIT